MHEHPVGDVVLRQFSAICVGLLRSHDVLGRLGGQEFGILLSHTDAEGVCFEPKKTRLAVVSSRIKTAVGELSIGVATLLGRG